MHTREHDNPKAIVISFDVLYNETNEIIEGSLVGDILEA